MIGNDLVYFPDWPKRKGERLKRFRRKIYSDSEIKRIENSPDPYFTEALFWSGKEAAYKVWFKETRLRRFNPKNFLVEQVSKSASQTNILINADGDVFHCKSILIDNYIHTAASDRELDLRLNLYWGEGNNPRKVLLLPGGWVIEKDDSGVPYGLFKNKRMDLSISHDGKRIACLCNQPI